MTTTSNNSPGDTDDAPSHIKNYPGASCFWRSSYCKIILVKLLEAEKSVNSKDSSEAFPRISEQFGPSIHKIRGLVGVHPQKFTRTSPRTWEANIFGSTLAQLSFAIISFGELGRLLPHLPIGKKFVPFCLESLAES